MESEGFCVNSTSIIHTETAEMKMMEEGPLLRNTPSAISSSSQHILQDHSFDDLLISNNSEVRSNKNKERKGEKERESKYSYTRYREDLSRELNPRIKVQLIHLCKDTASSIIGRRYQIPITLLEGWIYLYKEHGESEFLRREQNRIYMLSRKTKLLILREVKELGLEKTGAKYGIKKETMKDWENRVISVGEEEFGVKRAKGCGTYNTEQRMQIAREALSEGVNAVVIKYDIAKNTVEYWMNRLATFGEDGLKLMRKGNGDKSMIKDIITRFTQGDKLTVIKYYGEHGLKAACRKFGCSDYYIYLWKSQIQKLGEDNFLLGVPNTSANRGTRRKGDIAKKPADSLAALDELLAPQVVNNDQIGNSGDDAHYNYIDNNYNHNNNKDNNTSPNHDITDSTSIDINHIHNTKRTSPELVNIMSQICSGRDQLNIYNDQSEETASNEMKHKILFMEDMKKLLPPNMYIQFKHILTTLVDTFLYKALHTYTQNPQH